MPHLLVRLKVIKCLIKSYDLFYSRVMLSIFHQFVTFYITNWTLGLLSYKYKYHITIWLQNIAMIIAEIFTTNLLLQKTKYFRQMGGNIFWLSVLNYYSYSITLLAQSNGSFLYWDDNISLSVSSAFVIHWVSKRWLDFFHFS